MPSRHRTAAVAVLVVALGAAPGRPVVGAYPGDEARREDHGALIVLYLHGSYREMGRQSARLLGDLARAAQRTYVQGWREVVARVGRWGGVTDVVWPRLWAWAGPYYEPSGFFEELHGVADGLGLGRADVVRGFYGGILGGGSTAFVASGAASSTDGAVLGRNVDWSDDRGIRRPVVTFYRPSNGDRAFVTAGWVLSTLPIVGMNDAGLVMSLNFFDADDLVARVWPHMTYRRVVQRARSVDEAVRMLRRAPNLGGAALVLLADASGAFAVCECLSTRCARLTVADDWVALTNHARSPAMIRHDRGRTPDSVRRLAAVEAATRARLGRIDVRAATTILRDRANSAYANDSTVANLRVLNSVVVDPRARTLWHSVRRQPHAPLGRMVPFVLDPRRARPEAIPADARVGNGELAREQELVARMRDAASAFAAGRIEEASRAWDRVAAEGTGIVEPFRLRWARARARWTLGRHGEAEDLLGKLDDAAAPVEVRAYGLTALAAVRDRRGRRAAALAAYARADAYVQSLPEHRRARLFEPLHRWIAAGLRAPQQGPMPATPDLQAVPR